jgi:NAD(P)-dependent dehydrogenase (short-subunit alcohol dehydrogenase family)
MGQKILITGASSGIGRAAARLLWEHGHAVFLTGRDAGRLATVAEECGGAPMEVGELTESGVAARVVNSAAEALGGMDGVLHCAGAGLIKPLVETGDEEVTRILNVNTRAAYFVLRESCRVMAAAKRGLFATIPGILGRAAMRNATAYCASKWAVTGMVKAAALEYQRQGIRFTLLHLGGVDTPFWDHVTLAVQREKMIPAEVAASWLVAAVEQPGHLVLSEVVLQPESHQL